jgi:hypothetical protein
MANGMDRPESLPQYTEPRIKAALLAAGVSGTIYSLVMPESEDALSYIVDGGDRKQLIAAASDVSTTLDAARSATYLDRYREPWTQKQDAVHTTYFDRWLAWSAPIVGVDAGSFPHRYPTSGASEGIYKLMAEHAADCAARGVRCEIHIFEGEYEGFPAYAAALDIALVHHPRDNWVDVARRIPANAQFWISQPSAIDGMVWPDFEDFAKLLAEHSPQAQLLPDLTYVGCVARPFRVELDAPNIPAFVVSHSKPFGGYYHRVGGVFSRFESSALFGNKWFKNLQSLAWATEMMNRHAVRELPTKYRTIQEEAAHRAGDLLGVEALRPADVMLLGIAPPPSSAAPIVSAVLRGSGSGRVVRLCLTPAMTCLIDPRLAPTTAPQLIERWKQKGWVLA